MQNLRRAGQVLIAFFGNFLRNRGQNARSQNVRHHAEENNCCGKDGNRSLLQKIGWNVITKWRGRGRLCIDENRFQNEKVIIERDETTDQAKYDEPKKCVICASM